MESQRVEQRQGLTHESFSVAHCHVRAFFALSIPRDASNHVLKSPRRGSETRSESEQLTFAL